MLVNCVAYENGHKLADIPVDDVSEYLKRPGCFVWVALRDATEAELDQLQEEFGLHELAVEDARHGHQRPKIEAYGDILFTVAQLIEPGEEDWEVGEVDIFVGRNFVLSTRNRSRHGFLDVRERCESEPELLQFGAGFVFYALLDAVVDRYFPLLDTLETELDAIEDQIFAQEDTRSNIERLYDLKHRATMLRHAVAPLLEVVGKLHGTRPPPVCAPVREYFRDVEDHLTRINVAVEAMRDTINTAIQVNLAMVTMEQGETTKRLAAWAAIFAVSTVLVGIWGMNFQHMPELGWIWGYPLALSVIAGSALLMYWRFRRAGWL